MNLTLFGASGGTGRHVMEQALSAGHRVTAFVRDPSKITILDPRLRLVQGDILDPVAVGEAVAGADAVISALGPKNNEPVFEISRGIAGIVAAMQKTNVRRIVMTAGMGVAAPEDRPNLLNRAISLLLALMARNVAEDMRRAVRIVTDSNLDWTVVRAPRLVDKPGGGPLKIGYVGGEVGFKLARADFARVLLLAATEAKYLRQMPGVSN